MTFIILLVCHDIIGSLNCIYTICYPTAKKGVILLCLLEQLLPVRSWWRWRSLHLLAHGFYSGFTEA
jgi:hypothetical protein